MPLDARKAMYRIDDCLLKTTDLLKANDFLLQTNPIKDKLFPIDNQ